MASENANDDGPSKREHLRSSLMLKVEYKSTTEFINDYTENISAGGVFIATSATFSSGEVIDFIISFPGLLDPINIRGEIIWTRQASENDPAGIGVRFLMEESPDRDLLQSLIKKLQSEDTDQADLELSQEKKTFRVLLVEDNLVVRDMFRYGIQKLSARDGFSSSHFEVVEADNGKEGWELLRQDAFNLVIVDLYMPVMDGGQLIEMIRADERLKSIPVLVVSSGGRDGRLRAIQTGADVYLDKPIKLKEMMETIEALMTMGHSPK